MINILFSRLGRIITLSLFVAFMITSGCNCDPNAELNNFTSTPKEHVYQISGSAIAGFLRVQNNNSNCDPPQNFTARVMLSTRTASFVNGTVVPDPNPFPGSEIDDNFTFSKNTGFNQPDAKITVKVPSTGAYAIVATIELPECSNCCNGGLPDIHCSSTKTANTNGVGFTCKTGKPKIAFEKTFSTAERPDSRDNPTGVNLIVNESMFTLRKCYSCSTCTNPCN
jgi:hypothetical protein